MRKQQQTQTTDPPDLEGDRARRRDQLAAVETEASAVDAERQVIAAERKPLIVRSLDDPDCDAALTALEERDLKATARQRTLTEKADALRREIAKLADEIGVARQTRARAEAEQIAHTDILPALQRADSAVAALRDALAAARDAKQRQQRVLAAADLPEALSHKRFAFAYVDRVLRWELADYGMTGIRHHFAKGLTLAQCEAELQGLAPSVDDEVTEDTNSESKAAASSAA